MKSRYEQMMDVWVVLGGKLADRKGPAWTWRHNPTGEDLVQLLSCVPIEMTT